MGQDDQDGGSGGGAAENVAKLPLEVRLLVGRRALEALKGTGRRRRSLG